jgi:hypothetical protein
VLAAVAINGHAPRHASPELRADREVVLAAVASDRDALVHASAEFRADRNTHRRGVRSASRNDFDRVTAAELLKQIRREVSQEIALRS